MGFFGYPLTSSGTPAGRDPWEDVQAEVKCLHCGAKYWVSYADRQAGMQVPPKGVTPQATARCKPCLSGQNWTVWTGRTRHA